MSGDADEGANTMLWDEGQTHAVESEDGGRTTITATSSASSHHRGEVLLLIVLCVVVGLMHSKAGNISERKDEARHLNSCEGIDMSLFANGLLCGSPSSKPCFDFGRCNSPNKTSIYVYDTECSLLDTDTLLLQDRNRTEQVTGIWMEHRDRERRLRNEARDAGLLADTYDEACVFIHVDLGISKPCAVDTPLWRNGRNHLMVDMSDNGRDRRPEVANSYAMEAASNMHTCFYRTGYDISINLPPKKVFPDLAGITPCERRFFLTMKGTVYLSQHGKEERMSLLQLNDEEHAVVISMHCQEIHQEHLLPENADFCVSLKSRYHDHSYASLMNTTFGLVPAGRSPGTYRLGEVMSAGAIPVFVGRDFIPPFSELLDWPSFSFRFAPDEVGPEMVKTLRAVPKLELEGMQRKSLEAYLKMFGTDVNDFGPSAKILIDILRRRFGHRER